MARIFFGKSAPLGPFMQLGYTRIRCWGIVILNHFHIGIVRFEKDTTP